MNENTFNLLYLGQFEATEPQHKEVIKGDTYHGIYNSKCLDCSRDFLGYKSRLYCKLCEDTMESNEMCKRNLNG
jgi:hypothetical protein